MEAPARSSSWALGAARRGARSTCRRAPGQSTIDPDEHVIIQQTKSAHRIRLDEINSLAPAASGSTLEARRRHRRRGFTGVIDSASPPSTARVREDDVDRGHRREQRRGQRLVPHLRRRQQRDRRRRLRRVPDQRGAVAADRHSGGSDGGASSRSPEHPGARQIRSYWAAGSSAASTGLRATAPPTCLAADASPRSTART